VRGPRTRNLFSLSSSLSLSLSLSLSRWLFLSLSHPACPSEDSGGLVGLLVSHHVLAVLEEVVCRHLLVLVAREIRLQRDLSNIEGSEKAIEGSWKEREGNSGVIEGKRGCRPPSPRREIRLQRDLSGANAFNFEDQRERARR